jgi:hypothetical protein
MLWPNYFGVIAALTWRSALWCSPGRGTRKLAQSNFKHGTLPAASSEVNVLENPRAVEEAEGR